MFVKVRSMDGKANCAVDISKLTTVEEFRVLVEQELNVAPECQRLFFRGKQMEDGHTMFEYGANVNDVIQLMVRQLQKMEPKALERVDTGRKENDKNEANKSSVDARHEFSLNEPETGKSLPTEEEDSESWEHVSEDDYFEPGDPCDARDPSSGGWFEAVVRGIRRRACAEGATDTARRQYSVQFEGYDEDPAQWLDPAEVRERASVTLRLSDLSPGHEVLVNYNVDEPDERGFWFDAIVETVEVRGRRKRLTVTLYLGEDRVPLTGCMVKFPDEVMERGQRRRRQDRLSGRGTRSSSPAKREVAVTCKICRDRPDRDCRVCGCHVCHSKSQPERQIMCDECDMPFHIGCLTPPLLEIPTDDDWYCPDCKTDTSEVVLAGQKLKASKKKSKMASQVNDTKRDWGKGMATAGRQKVCSIVPTNHFGPVPGVEVGMRWQYRIQASEAGVHRPHVAGIAGREKEGAFSIVLSGGYEDDVDNGDEFYYTGSGGRDLSGNKRTAGQTCDQQLTRMNRALALNCHAKVNTKTGTSADEWKKGKPVRVIRSYKLQKHSEYAPPEGLRYDGLYKIVKYWPEKGKSGFLVWRYLMKRDDPVPAPWTKEGLLRIEELGIQDMVRVEVPDSARAAEGSDHSGEEGPPSKRPRPAAYTPEQEVVKRMETDQQNTQLWQECRETLQEGKLKFLDKVTETFMCICCQELVCPPVTLPCHHNVCQPCLRRSFKAEVFSCPACRHELGKKFAITANDTLFEALKLLFPGYQQGR